MSGSFQSLPIAYQWVSQPYPWDKTKWQMWRKIANQQGLLKVLKASPAAAIRKAKAETANKLEEGDELKPLIPEEYCDLAEVLSKKNQTPSHPTDIQTVQSRLCQEPSYPKPKM